MFKQFLKISPTVLKAFNSNLPVVALQSTIISHGMPYPNNRECALEVEEVVRQYGATPATIAIIDGLIHVGLTQQNIEQFSKNGHRARKVSRRDLPYVIAKKEWGATTVSGTMICSEMAGIDVFVTGGIGGVHRGFEQTMDVSADLRELGRTAVTVVSAGVKNILDIPRTIEYLQTEGVPVITYGSKFFPAFFSPSSGIQSPLSMDSINDIAELLNVRKKLNLQNGILVAVPNEQTGDGKLIQNAITQALREAHQQGIKGAATTPFLLKRVHTITAGASIKSNVNLIKLNAVVGAQLAVQLKNLENRNRINHSEFTSFAASVPKVQAVSVSQSTAKINRKLIVVGGSAVDYEVSVTDGKFELYQSCKGVWRTTYGGVGRNIAEVAKRLGTETVFVTALGGDNTSSDLRNNILSHGIELHQINDATCKAPTYLGVLDDNHDAIIGISNMDVNDNLNFDKIYEAYFREEQRRGHNREDIVVLDANLVDSQRQLLKLLQYLQSKGYFVVFECKGRKAMKVATDKLYEYISLLKMNYKQRELVVKTLRQNQIQFQSDNQYQWFARNVGSQSRNHTLTSVNTIITNGAQDLKAIHLDGKVQSFKSTRSDRVIKTTGAGDTLTGVLCSMLLRGQSIDTAIRYGIVASKMTIESESKLSPICEYLNLANLTKQFEQCRSRQLI